MCLATCPCICTSLYNVSSDSQLYIAIVAYIYHACCPIVWSAAGSVYMTDKQNDDIKATKAYTIAFACYGLIISDANATLMFSPREGFSTISPAKMNGSKPNLAGNPQENLGAYSVRGPPLL